MILLNWSFKNKICGVDLADMQSSSKYNKGIKYLLCAIDLFSKYAWFVPLKDKRGICIVNVLQKIISKGCKPNKIWVDQGGDFYNKLLKRFMKINNMCIQHTMKENLLLLKDWDVKKTRFLDTRQLFQRMFI